MVFFACSELCGLQRFSCLSSCLFVVCGLVFFIFDFFFAFFFLWWNLELLGPFWILGG